MSSELETIENVNIIRAVPHKSRLPTVPEGSYTLSHEVVGTIDRAALEQLLVESGESEEDVRKGFRFFDKVMHRVVALALAGYNVNTDWFRAVLILSGIVPAARLGHNAHPGEVDTKVNLVEDKRIRDMVEAMTVLIHEAEGTGAPVIQSVKEATGTTPDTIRIGRMVELRGLNIAIRGPAVLDIGVFLTPTGGGSLLRISPDQCAPNTPSLVQFIAPAALTPGQWTVKLATQFLKGNAQFSTEIREAAYPNPVTVLAAST